MALTKEDLQAISALMDAKLEPINNRLDEMATKNDLNALRAEMREDFEKVHGDIGRLYESSDKNMKLINEGLGHLNNRYAQLGKVEQTTEDHGNRIFALEQLAANK